jgi:hypothetical protein
LHAWWGGLNERDVCEERSVDGRDWKGVKWTDLAQNAENFQADVDPVIELLVSIKLISCVREKCPKKDSYGAFVDSHVIQLQ